jgi:hypothetical protein
MLTFLTVSSVVKLRCDGVYCLCSIYVHCSYCSCDYYECFIFAIAGCTSYNCVNDCSWLPLQLCEQLAMKFDVALEA